MSEDAGLAVEAMCEHLAGHGARLEITSGSFRLGFPFGRALIDLDGARIRMQAIAPDVARLFQLRSILAGHLAEFAPDAEALRWTGDATDLTVPPNWRELRVEALHDLTPRMRRIRFRADDLIPFAGLQNIHVRLAFPPSQKSLIAPGVSSSGRESWPDHIDRPKLRRYTIREIDPVAGWLDVDFVLHEEATGPGSAFAAEAGIGDVIGMIGPGGGSIPLDQDWYLIAGDETALPAIARMLALLPPDATGHVVIETCDEAERQTVDAPAGMQVSHILRAEGLTHTVAKIAVPQTARQPFVWIGCEYAAFRALRRHVRDNLRIEKGGHNIVAYWREGVAED
ncbi:siderophore-interacting protein [Paracoccus caeni]|uniref:Siderophore-interacting protein n=1 Tax=Paracoccus caeni TaxID=657651 RepID=A0A934SAC5_9RHOB|nr:siderophore-interacting protein [Paracoccus caeni]